MDERADRVAVIKTITELLSQCPGGDQNTFTMTVGEAQVLLDIIKEQAIEIRRLNAVYLDKPEDCLWHDADRTWWRKIDGDLVSADAPVGVIDMLSPDYDILSDDPY